MRDALTLWLVALSTLLARPAGEDDPLLRVHTYNTLGASLAERGRLEEAERWIRAALDLGRPVLSASDPALLRLESNLAQILCQTGRAERAEPILRRILAAEEQSGRHNVSFLAQHHHNLGALYLQTGRLTQARAHLDIALAHWQSLAALPLESIETFTSSALLAFWQHRTLDAQSALDHGRQVVLIHHLDHSAAAAGLHSIAGMLASSRGARALALDEFEAALRLHLSLRPATHPLVLANVDLYSRELDRQGNRPGVRQVARWRKKLLATAPGESFVARCPSGQDCGGYYRARYRR